MTSIMRRTRCMASDFYKPIKHMKIAVGWRGCLAWMLGAFLCVWGGNAVIDYTIAMRDIEDIRNSSYAQGDVLALLGRLTVQLDNAALLASSGKLATVHESFMTEPEGTLKPTFDFKAAGAVLTLNRGFLKQRGRGYEVMKTSFSGSVEPGDVSVSVSVNWNQCMKLTMFPAFWMPRADNISTSMSITRDHASTPVFSRDWNNLPWKRGPSPTEAYAACSDSSVEETLPPKLVTLGFRFRRLDVMP